MNERIRELLRAANQHANEVEITAFRNKSFQDIVQEKFAELIVQECAGLFDKNETDVRIPEYRVHDSIMIHFGLY